MDNYSISTIPNQETEKSVQIKLKGELSIPYIQEIKEKLEKAIKDFEIVEILVADVSIIDLTMLQYLLSLKKSEDVFKKSFKISLELDNDLSEILEHAGFKNIENLSE
ncbi:MAG: hypothetical protein PF484_02890 [Bacteroidales bacterium]|jgi:ABC-type transporter Mla MlaB component|nr:hypothetical protein [Bacteroidales bacterium]